MGQRISRPPSAVQSPTRHAPAKAGKQSTDKLTGAGDSAGVSASRRRETRAGAGPAGIGTSGRVAPAPPNVVQNSVGGDDAKLRAGVDDIVGRFLRGMRSSVAAHREEITDACVQHLQRFGAQVARRPGAYRWAYYVPVDARTSSKLSPLSAFLHDSAVSLYLLEEGLRKPIRRASAGWKTPIDECRVTYSRGNYVGHGESCKWELIRGTGG